MADIHGGLAALNIQPVLAVPRGLAHAAAFRAGTPECEDFLHVHTVDRETTLTVFRNGRPLLIRPLISLEDAPEINRLAVESRRTLISAGLMAGNEGGALSGFKLVVQGLGETETGAISEALSVGPAETIRVEPSPFPAALTPDGRLPFLFNFCIGPYRPDSFAGRHRISLAACLLLAVLAFGLNLAGLYRQTAILETQVDQIRQMSGTVYAETFPGAKQVQAAPLLLMESRMKQAKTRAAGRSGEHERRQVFSVMDILKDLSGRIPAEVDMEISRLTLNHGRLVLTGTTGNFNDVDRIKGLLQGA
ncbi:MAG: hypothetical protein MI802_22350, partial [Desulfobacterales bacterium]|nr:hypothetical protein [Desulfobacterales bacterium]